MGVAGEDPAELPSFRFTTSHDENFDILEQILSDDVSSGHFVGFVKSKLMSKPEYSQRKNPTFQI